MVLHICETCITMPDLGISDPNYVGIAREAILAEKPHHRGHDLITCLDERPLTDTQKAIIASRGYLLITRGKLVT